MDSMKDKSRTRIKLLSDLLDVALLEFVCKGLFPSKGEKKFQHMTNLCCIGHPPDDPVTFLL
jgi:hypothetical protein